MEELHATTAELRPEELIAQQQLKSTYQGDYIGMQQGTRTYILERKKTSSILVFPDSIPFFKNVCMGVWVRDQVLTLLYM